MNPEKKQFDCVEFKRKAQAAIYEQTKGMTPAQEVEFFRNAAQQGPLGKRWAAITARQTSHTRRAG